ncbi:glycosyltransferase family 39 protein [Calothrix sp. NIES-2098]|uniref:glycosyltransferase family 39 protein n=1 Tax=Calothrix sp. NIES-2098 TaxID=1954171 RepID=UPI000B612861|nr:hypothetical protein NIES2098_28440 [Calothrix sp. NIES-2098]
MREIKSRFSWLTLNNIYPYAVFIILIFALVIRLFGLNKGIWNDEYATIDKISQPSISEMFQLLKEDVHPPLYYILLYFWGKISKTEEFLRIFSIVLNLASLGVVTIWMKQYSRLASVLTGIYLTTSPIILRYSQELKAYSLLFFATSIAFLFASRAIDKPEKYSGYIGLSFSLSVAVATHLVGIMLIPAILGFMTIMALIYRKNIQFIKVAITIIIPCLIFGYFKLYWLNELQQIQNTWWWMPPIDWHLLSSTSKYVFGLSSLYLPDYIIPLVGLIFCGLIAIVVIFGKYKVSFPFFVSAIVFWLAIIIYSVINSPIFYYRTILPSLIPLIGFLTLQIATIQAKRVKIAAIVCLVLLSLISTVNWVTNQAYKPVEENRKVAHFIESQWQSKDLVLFYNGFFSGTVQYYFEHLPTTGQISIIDTNRETIDRDISTAIAKRNGNIKPKNIFLVVVMADFEGYKNLLSAIQYKFGRQVNFYLLFINSHNPYFSKKFTSINEYLAASKSQLGEPSSYQDFGSYVISKYELQ